MHNLTNDQKKRVTIPGTWKHVLIPYLKIHVECAVKSWNVSGATLEKEGWRSWHLQTHKDPVKKVKPDTAASCLINRQATGETRKMANCFTWLKRITGLKTVNSEIKSKDPTSYLERYSPRGSRHLVEPTWVTHLLRTVVANSVVECILRAKHPNYTWQEWVGEETREKLKRYHCHVQC